MQLIGRLIAKARFGLSELRSCWRRWSSWVWNRVRFEPGYAESLAALWVAAATLLCRDDRLRRLGRRIARTASTFVHAASRYGSRPYDPLAWE